MLKRCGMIRTVYIILILIISNTAYSELTRKVVKKYFNSAPREVIYFNNNIEIVKEMIAEDGKVIKTIGRIPDGIIKEYYNDGKVMAEWNYKDGVYNGINRVYHRNGKMSVECNYKNGVLNGAFKRYYENGDIASESNYWNGMVTKTAETYYLGGQLKSSSNYLEGREDGAGRQYYATGKIKSEWNIKNGQTEGALKIYYEDGKRESEINYREGKKNGISKSYYKDGKLSLIEEYENDKLQSLKKYYEADGKLIVEWNQKNGDKKADPVSPGYFLERSMITQVVLLVMLILGVVIYGLVKKNVGRKKENAVLGRLSSEIRENVIIGKENLKEYNERGKKKKAKLFLREMSSLEWKNVFSGGKISLIKDSILLKMLYAYYSKIEYLLFIEKSLPFPKSIKINEEKYNNFKFHNDIIMQYKGINEESGIIETGENLLKYLNNKEKKTKDLFHFYGLIASIHIFMLPAVLLPEVITIKENSGNITTGVCYDNGREVARITYNEEGKTLALTGNIPDGVVNEYYEDGRIKEEQYFKAGMMDGRRMQYNRNGIKKTESLYKAGKMNGLFKIYDDSGRLIKETSYKNDKFDGINKEYLLNNGKSMEEYYVDGVLLKRKKYYNKEQLCEETNYKEGKIDGEYRRYYNSGKIMAQGLFKNGKGELKEYYVNGDLLSMTRCVSVPDIRPDGPVKYYYQNGNMESDKYYESGELSGESKTYFENGKLKSEGIYKAGAGKVIYYFQETGRPAWEYNYINNIIEGPCREYYTNGRLMGEYNYINGKKEGTGRIYGNETGKLKIEKHYKNDKLEGPIKEYFEDGVSVESENNYKNGNLEGVGKKYYLSGNLKQMEYYKNNELEGAQKSYYENGKLSGLDFYANGKIMNSKRYGSDGILFLEEDYIDKPGLSYGGTLLGLSDYLRTLFFKTKIFTVLDRSKMEEIVKEQKLQLSGMSNCSKSECVVEIGKIFNVSHIVVTSVTRIAKEYVINIRIVSVESSEVIITDLEKSDSEKELLWSAEKLVIRIADKVKNEEKEFNKRTIAVLDISNK